MDSQTGVGRRTEARRSTKACDTCHRRGRRCTTSPESAFCSFCLHNGLSCTWNRVPAKRGPKPKANTRAGHICAAQVPQPSETAWRLDERKHGSRDVLTTLIRSYFDFVYPISNYVHEQTFMDRWTAGQLPNSRPSYGLLMAMCSLTAYRIQKGIAPAEPGFSKALRPEVYLQEARSSVELSLVVPKGTEDLQAVALLCVTGLEMGDAALLQQYLGLYHAAVASQSLYDENRWPQDMPTMEREQCRRLYWYMYRLEVHTALVMGHPVRCPELQSLVAYPEVPDFDSSEAEGGGNGDGDDDEGNVEWLTGWNFVTDLYRGLEHLMAKFRPRRLSMHHSRIAQSTALPTMFLVDFDPESKILLPLKTALDSLPVRFRLAQPLSTNVAMNRCGFQATNIVCTYQLVRIMAYAFTKATFSQACRTAIDLVEEMASIPLDYLKWTTLAATQELSGIGHILWQFMHQDLLDADYRELKSALLCIKEYLESLQSSFTYVQRASLRMGKYVEEIDQVLLEREQDAGCRKDASQPSENVAFEPHQHPLAFMDEDALLAWREVFRDW